MTFFLCGAFLHGLGIAPDPVKSLLLLEKAISLGCCAAVSLRAQVIRMIGPERYRSVGMQIAKKLGF